MASASSIVERSSALRSISANLRLLAAAPLRARPEDPVDADLVSLQVTDLDRAAHAQERRLQAQRADVLRAAHPQPPLLPGLERHSDHRAGAVALTVKPSCS